MKKSFAYPLTRTGRTSRKRFPRSPLFLEPLEDRVTPSTLIPVTTRRDLVFDSTRDLLYITTSAGTVERYDVAAQTLLTPWTVGTALYGADITPDAGALYVAENKVGSTQGVVHKVNLATGTVTDLSYTLASSEGGSWDVAIGANGKGLVTTQFQGSGWVPLRQLDLSTDTLSIRTDDPGSGFGGQVRQNSNLWRGADRSLFLLEESNDSGGPFFTYDAAADTFPKQDTTDLFLDNALATVNRTGSLIAVEVGGAAAVMDRNFTAIQNLSGVDGGLAFDPVRDVLYGVNSTTDQVIAYDTTTLTEKYRLPIGENVSTCAVFGSGMMAVSGDGSFLFLSTPSGVREFNLPAATGVANTLAVAGFPAYILGGTAGSVTVTAKDPAGNTATGYRGTVHFSSSDAAATLPADYTFTAGDNGVHTFSATLRTAGTQSLTVTDTAAPTLTGTQAGIVVHTTPTTLIPVATHRDLVFDPVRNLLYITTSGGTVERYDVAAQTLLAPLAVGNTLNGADVTPDGASLYVAEGQRNVTQEFLRQVNLTTGAVTNLTFDRTLGENGAWDVAIGPGNKGLFDTQFAGSGWVPLRQVDTSTDALSIRTDDPGSGFGGQVRQNTHIQRGADRSLFLLEESDISSGPIFTYDAVADTFPKQLNTNQFLDNVLSAVNRNGTLVAMEIGFQANIVVRDRNLNTVATLSNLAGGVAFDPLLDVLYGVNTSTSQIIAYDTNTWAEKYRLSIGETVGSAMAFGSGVMVVSDDGKRLFLATPTGVRVFNLPNSSFQVSGFPSPDAAGVAASFTVTAKDSSGNTLPNYRGTVHFTSNDPQASLPADYTFTAGDNGSHTFSATLKTLGIESLTATDAANGMRGTQPNIAVVPSLVVNLPATVTAGDAVNVTITAKDGSGNPATTYRGTVHFTSSDGQAGLPGDYTFTAGDNGAHVFSVTLKTAGSQSVTVTDTAFSSVTGSASTTVNPAAVATLRVAGFPSPTTAGVAGTFTVTAKDAFGNTVVGYGGTVHFTSSDGQATLPADSPLTSGTGSFSATLKTAGSQTLTATDTATSSLTGTSTPIIVNAAAASHLGISAPAAAITGTAFSFTVTALDPFNNTATGYTGTVHFTSSDPTAALPGNSTLTSGSGSFSATLNKSGSQTLTATDTGTSTITGTSNSITVRGLVVSSFTPTPTGFGVTFSKPFVNSSSNPLNLYNAASAGYGAADVTLVGSGSLGSVHGSLIIDPSNTRFTFIKTGGPVGGGTTGLLAAGTYTVTLVSGVTAFQDTSGVPLDGNNDGINGDNYVTTFTVTAPTGVVVTVPDFARGPDSTDAINVPNNAPNGIPIALSNGVGVTDATFVLQYNATLLTITGGAVNPVLTGATFTVTTSGSGAAAQATIVFHSPTALAAGAVRLGGLTATVPSNALYKSKELLHWSSLSLNNGAFPTVADDGIHAVVFLGDTSGDGTYTSADSVLISRVASAADSGFAAFPVLDPVIVGDLNGDGRVTATDGGLLNNYLAGNPVLQVPPYPGPPSNNPSGPDPTLSIPTDLRVDFDGTVTVPVNIDDAHPAGSTGLTQAVLALRYDPTFFSVSAADIHLGTVPDAGTGWTLQARVDAATGQIGIILFSATPITSTVGGSLVTITFHVRPGARLGATPINLSAAVDPNGQGVLWTALDDDQGPLTLHPAPTSAATDAGVDGLGVLTAIDPVPGGFVVPPLGGTANLLEQVFQDLARGGTSPIARGGLPPRNEPAAIFPATVEEYFTRAAPGGALAFGGPLVTGRRMTQHWVDSLFLDLAPDLDKPRDDLMD